MSTVRIHSITKWKCQELMKHYDSAIIRPDNMPQLISLLVHDAYKKLVWPKMSREEQNMWMDKVRKDIATDRIKKTYIIRDDVTGLYKIGRSKNPKQRYQHLVCANPSITLKYISEQDVESEIHELYQDQKYKSEWFNLTLVDLHEIVRTYDFVPVQWRKK
jgi:hypothetical protein